MGESTIPKAAVAAYSLILLAANLIVIWPLFQVEYSAYTSTVEGTFIAIAARMTMLLPTPLDDQKTTLSGDR